MTTEGKLVARWRASYAAPTSGWDFSEFDGRVEESRPPWSYEALARDVLRNAGSALDLGTGGGEFLRRLADVLPQDTWATEGWPANLPVARAALEPHGIRVADYDAERGDALPFPDARFDVVLSRHEAYSALEVRRVLRPGGRFVTQQVDGRNLADLAACFGDGPAYPEVILSLLRQEAVDAGLVPERAEEWSGPIRFADVDPGLLPAADALAAACGLHRRTVRRGAPAARAPGRSGEVHRASLPAGVPAAGDRARMSMSGPVAQTHTHQLTFAATEVRKRYVGWDRGEPDREWACLSLLAEQAPGLAPRPLRRETCDGAPVVVMERLAGEPLGRAPLTADQTASLGLALRRLYDVPVADVRAAGIGERCYGPTAQARAMSAWLRQPHDLASCRDPDLVGRAVEAALRWLAAADRLPAPRLVVLGIADLNPANVLWDGARCRLVDFEDAGLSDPAYELADHVEHLAGRLGGIVDGEALIEAVGLGGEDLVRLQAYRPLWAAFWLAMLLPGNRGFTRNPPGTIEAQAAHLLSLLS